MESPWVVLSNVWSSLGVLKRFLGGLTSSLGGLKDVSGVLEGLLKLQKQIGALSDAKMVSVNDL